MTSNYNFMKSGFNILNEEPLSDEMTENLYSMVFAFMEKAVVNASTYVTHSKRSTITKKDIKLGLKLETFLFLSRPNFMEDIRRWKVILNDNDDSETALDKLAEQRVINSTDTDELIGNFKSSCSCKTCDGMNTIETKWDNWKPHNQIEFILKKTVSKIS